MPDAATELPYGYCPVCRKPFSTAPIHGGGYCKPDDPPAASTRDAWNELVGRLADYDENEHDPRGYGKRVPYIGWYWRRVDWDSDFIYVGDCGDFIGFMENNKWGYPERSLTPDEAAQVREIVGAAVLAANDDDAKAKLAELWPLMQTFTMEVEGFWIYGVQGRVGFAKTEDEADRTIELLSEAGGGLPYRKVAAST